ncbi:hypothetical protein DRE_04139 [Drechslerella stenobrocha 248]|uniref:F-box domain-containing protein n=1 Tax=Drechslerella stenobrocha 248 TaxID=1043628 RepID=W7I2L9_9PEZI|nr:hypothetical protein DRE_04139 [Drechslerella stenobrocha 248]
MTASNFDRIPYLNAYPLETSFPYLTPDTALQASRTSSLDCARVVILGSLKANRLRGSPRQLSTQPNRPENASPRNSCTPAEQYLHHLLTSFVFQRLFLQHLSTYDLISLRQTSRFLRQTLDRERSLWRTINFSSPRHTFDPIIPSRGPPTPANQHQNGAHPSTTGECTSKPLRMSRIASNHIPGSPISPYHHMRVLILDNYRFPTAGPTCVEDTLYTLFSNDCVRRTLKLLSMRGVWNLSIFQAASYLRDWEIGIRGHFRRDLGWRYIDSIDSAGKNGDSWRTGFEIVDKKGQRVPREVWWADRGWALEVFRFASPRLFTRNHGGRRSRAIPAAVPGYLHLPAEQAEVGENGTPYYRSYEEFLVQLPLDTRIESNEGVVHAMRSAERIGVQIDVGMCKNLRGHNPSSGLGGPEFWAIAERRWEHLPPIQ